MTTYQKLSVLMSMLFLLSAIPTMAQTDNEVILEAPFAFYAGDVKMPAGSYTLTPDDNTNVLLIKSADGSHSAFVEYELVESGTRPSDSEITFNKYGKTDFLNRISMPAERFAMRILPSDAEQSAAKSAAAEQHSLSAKSGR
jgi:hypothetical protein